MSPFTGTLDPSYELLGLLVSVLRADAEHASLLFQPRARINDDDDRVYQADVVLPDELRQVLPRVLVDTTGNPADVEQADAEGDSPLREVAFSLFTFVDEPYRDLGEQLHARQRKLIASTPLSNSHIILSAPVPEGPYRPTRELAFQNAWRFMHVYRVKLVGVTP